MTNEQQFILDALRTALCGKPERLNAWKGISLDTETIVRIVLRNGILLTVYPALTDLPTIQSVLRDRYFAALQQAVMQEYEGNQILCKLNDAGLDCIALKGWELRKLYPNTAMRQMADLDILVRPYDYVKIRALMKELGFTGRGGTESSWKHDSFSKGGVTAEMHKRLTDDSGGIRAWEDKMWAHAAPIEPGSHVFRMSPEDYYIFHFIHLHKDFLNGSLGLRRIADTWLLDRSGEQNREFVHTELKKLGIETFHDRMVKLSRAAMGEECPDESTDLLLQHAFTHGIYGSDKSYKAGRIASMGDSLKMGKIRSLVSAIFLPIGRMKAQYPILENKPLLLPAFWVKRILWYLRGGIMKNKTRLDYRNISDEDYHAMKSFFEAGGIL